MSNISVAEFQQVFSDIYERETVEAILEIGKLKKIRADDWMLDIGDPILYMPLLLKGQLRVLREDAEGHELLIYYIRPGETCAMSLICCSGNAVSNVRAVAEEDSELLVAIAEAEVREGRK